MEMIIVDGNENKLEMTIDFADPHFKEKMKEALEQYELERTEFYKALQDKKDKE